MSRTPPLISPAAYAKHCARNRRPYHDRYFAMYSGVLDALITDPVLMTIPIDDHMVHRGDGVFEALKCVDGCLYNFSGHCRRLRRSARQMGLKMPVSQDHLTALVTATVRAGGRRDCMVRIFLARGPGGFSVDPYESPVPILYIVVTAAGVPFMATHPGGARVRSSAVPAKSDYLATVKSCNYIPNILMRREAIDSGVDFTVAFDANGHMTEGATENFGIVSAAGQLLFPRMEHMLCGTTMERTMALARKIERQGRIRTIGHADIDHADLRRAREILITGTTLNVVSVIEFDGVPVGDGKPGPVGRELANSLANDMRGNRTMRYPVWPCSLPK